MVYKTPPAYLPPNPHQGIGSVLTQKDYFEKLMPGIYEKYHCPPWSGVPLHPPEVEFPALIKHENGRLRIKVDIRPFKPDEVFVKVSDGFLVLQAEHDERLDPNGYITRKIFRRFELPEDIEAKGVTAKVYTDGVMTFTAPLKPPPISLDGRIVPIVMTGPIRELNPHID